MRRFDQALLRVCHSGIHSLNTMLIIETSAKNKQDVRDLLLKNEFAVMGPGSEHPSIAFILNAMEKYAEDEDIPFPSRVEVENWSSETLMHVVKRIAHILLGFTLAGSSSF